ncbi:MAG: hypothetical protein DHS20C02_18040 [Micavibrio sp.]|nr:MAG: hypothetical protein DHS20C02_18040 [Micavibrio sp.]
MEFLTNLLHKIRGRSDADFLLLDRPLEPQKGKIRKEPLLAKSDGQLVMVVDHMFDDIPGWVEWNPDTQMVSITQMGGRVDEVRTAISRQYVETLLTARKLLLVSNVSNVSNKEDGKIMHFVPFLVKE